MPEHSNIIPMLISLTAVIVAPIVAFKVAKQQILSPIKQKWIDELRDIMSEILSEAQRSIVMNEGGGILNAEAPDEKLYLKLHYLECKLQLMLSLDDKNHTDLIKLVRTLTDEVHHGVRNYIEFGETISEIAALSHEVLRAEWQSIKRGDL